MLHRPIGHACATALVLAGCASQDTTQGSSQPHCGAGTVEQNGTCQVAPELGIVNGDTRASATTHWSGKMGAFTYQLAFYGDHTGVFFSAGAPSCPGVCAAPTIPCGDVCADTTKDAANCGTCGHACTGTQACVISMCVTPDGGPSSEPGTGTTTGGAGLFSWSALANGGVLNGRSDGRPFKNLTNIAGGVGDGNFSATLDGGLTVQLTLASGAVCK